MIPKNLHSFVSKLLEATNDGLVRWTEGAPNSYFCNHKSYELHLKRIFDYDAEMSSFQLLMKSGARDAIFTVVEDETPDYAMMRNVYEAVTVNAAGFDSIEEDFFN